MARRVAFSGLQQTPALSLFTAIIALLSLCDHPVSTNAFNHNVQRLPPLRGALRCKPGHTLRVRPGSHAAPAGPLSPLTAQSGSAQGPVSASSLSAGLLSINLFRNHNVSSACPPSSGALGRLAAARSAGCRSRTCACSSLGVRPPAPFDRPAFVRLLVTSKFTVPFTCLHSEAAQGISTLHVKG